MFQYQTAVAIYKYSNKKKFSLTSYYDIFPQESLDLDKWKNQNISLKNIISKLRTFKTYFKIVSKYI